jgi:hypothetical protein
MPKGGIMKRLFLIALALGLVAAACSSGSTDTTAAPAAPDTTAAAPATTTTKAAVTTTAAQQTTTTATAAPPAQPIEATPVVAALQPYNEEGALLFPAESVEAHWYQWDGLYVVLYRGWNASDGSPICPGNSTADAAGAFTSISNSPHNAEADTVCGEAPHIADAPSGAYACDSLLYYRTEIPTSAEGSLWGTLEFLDGVIIGQTSAAPIDLANTPEFEPGLAAYDLPPSTVDAGGVVACG